MSDTPRKLSCHCGAVVIEVRLSRGLDGAGRCNCSFCKRRGAIMAAAPREGLRILQGGEALTLYQWGTRTAEHWFCSICGIYTHHRRRSNPEEYGVNVGALDGVDPRSLDDVRWFDGANHPADRG